VFGTQPDDLVGIDVGAPDDLILKLLDVKLQARSLPDDAALDLGQLAITDLDLECCAETAKAARCAEAAIDARKFYTAGGAVTALGEQRGSSKRMP